MKPIQETTAERVRRVCGEAFGGRVPYPNAWWLIGLGLLAVLLAILFIAWSAASAISGVYQHVYEEIELEKMRR